MGINIAIDGPAGAGKSTIAKLIAKKLNYIYVDTGAMYRAIAYYTLSKNIAADDEKAIGDCIENIQVTIKYLDGEQHVYVGDEDVTPFLRQEATGNRASAVAKLGVVRTKLVALQREIAAKENVVMDGRDIGTTVLPNAGIKIYLTASSAVRAKRRYDELIAKGGEADLDQIEKDIIDRDNADMSREISPLKQAEDAVLIDSSYMTIDEVVDKVVALTC